MQFKSKQSDLHKEAKQNKLHKLRHNSCQVVNDLILMGHFFKVVDQY